MQTQAGGATAAAKRRRLDEHASITVSNREPHISCTNCGLPYHVEGVIKTKEALLLQTPEAMLRQCNVDVCVRQEVTVVGLKGLLDVIGLIHKVKDKGVIFPRMDAIKTR